MREQIKIALEEAEQKLSEQRQRYAQLQQQAAQLNADGVAAEKIILGLEGETRALKALVGNGE